MLKFYSGEFLVKRIYFDTILEDFKLLIFSIKAEIFYGESKDEKQKKLNNMLKSFYSKIKNEKEIYSFYVDNFSKKIYLLGSKECSIDKEKYKEYINKVEEIDEKEILDIKDITLFNLFVRYIPYEEYRYYFPKDSINFKTINDLIFHIKTERDGDVLRCLELKLARYGNRDRNEIWLNQVTFTKIDKVNKKEKYKNSIKMEYNHHTNLIIPSDKESGQNIYVRYSGKKENVIDFIPLKRFTERTRARYFTLFMKSIEEKLEKYFEVEFSTLESYEQFKFRRGAGTHFTNSVFGKSKGVINIYQTKDVKKSGEVVVSCKLGAERVKKELEEIFKEKMIEKNIKIKLKGEVGNKNRLRNEDWNIFILNDATGKMLEIDTYGEIKKKGNIISQGIGEEKIENSGLKTVCKKLFEEIFIKEQIKRRSIKNLLINYKDFVGVKVWEYSTKWEEKSKKTIRVLKKIEILEDGKFISEKSNMEDGKDIIKEFIDIAESFDNMGEAMLKKYNEGSTIDRLKGELKLIEIKGNKILIEDTSLRLYYDFNKFVELKSEKLVNRKKGEDGTLKYMMNPWFDKERQYYYSYYFGSLEEENFIFSPNIKKLISTRKISEEEYKLYGDSLGFKYLTSGSKIIAYPIFFKILKEL